MSPTAPTLTLRVAGLVGVAMLAFAGNSLLCRMALKFTRIDAASFTTVRLLSGAAMLAALLAARRNGKRMWAGGDWGSALALFAYAALFSFAYLAMTAATGALLLFGAVQASMIAWGIWQGERLPPLPLAGFVIALAGLLLLMLPGLATPGWLESSAMLGAGIAWGAYSLRGKQARQRSGADPTEATAGNFVRTVPMALLLSLALQTRATWDTQGLLLAVASGAVTSGLGYAVWYRVLPALPATHAATVQLSVPLIAALGGVLLLGEHWTLTLALASVAIVGGIALVVAPPKP